MSPPYLLQLKRPVYVQDSGGSVRSIPVGDWIRIVRPSGAKTESGESLYLCSADSVAFEFLVPQSHIPGDVEVPA